MIKRLILRKSVSSAKLKSNFRGLIMQTEADCYLEENWQEILPLLVELKIASDQLAEAESNHRAVLKQLETFINLTNVGFCDMHKPFNTIGMDGMVEGELIITRGFRDSKFIGTIDELQSALKNTCKNRYRISDVINVEPTARTKTDAFKKVMNFENVRSCFGFKEALNIKVK